MALTMDGVAIGNGILTVENEQQAIERADPKQTGSVAQHAPSDYLRRFWVDTILHHPKVMRFTAEMMGMDRLVLGTDESFPPHEADPLGALRAAAFTPEEIRRIGVENPRQLFRLP